MLDNRKYYYKVLLESTGSVKYIRTSSAGCKVIILGGIEPRQQTSENPYPMDSGEQFENITLCDFMNAEMAFKETKKKVYSF